MALYYQLASMSAASTHKDKCNGAAKLSDEAIVRRSANYQPTIWGDDFVQSLKSHVEKSSEERAEKLKEEVRLMLDTAVDSVQQLELIDVLQRLYLISLKMR
ncbi:terpene synthase 10-like [Mangifera indica]|uniref:terpene synthase 10-like n=1 Tax=Mangifera indica TaxID=29780 RepID=UPI001CFB16A6|nr:terpene synthase 10-like [Mangifera indica]